MNARCALHSLQPLGTKRKTLENSISQRLLLHLGVNRKNCNEWPTVYEENDFLHFILSNAIELKVSRNVFDIFISYWCKQSVSCHLWKFLLSTNYCSEVQSYSELTFIKPQHCWTEIEQYSRDNAMQHEK